MRVQLRQRHCEERERTLADLRAPCAGETFGISRGKSGGGDTRVDWGMRWRWGVWLSVLGSDGEEQEEEEEKEEKRRRRSRRREAEEAKNREDFIETLDTKNHCIPCYISPANRYGLHCDSAEPVLSG